MELCSHTQGPGYDTLHQCKSYIMVALSNLDIEQVCEPVLHAHVSVKKDLVAIIDGTAVIILI